MFTENEVSALINYPNILQETVELKERFIKEEAEFLEISDHDFLSLVLLTPSVGVALSNGSVSLFEEMALNKKARKLSKGGFWMTQDPVVFAMELLIKNYDKWYSEFLKHIKSLIKLTAKDDSLMDSNFSLESTNDNEQCIIVLKSSFIIIRYITSFFMNDEEEDILAERKIAKIEFDRINEIAEDLGITEIPVFQIYRSKLTVK